jgi:hypothetical protein
MFSPAHLNAPRSYLAGRPNRRLTMPDIIWLAVLGGLFLATLAFVRLCDNA